MSSSGGDITIDQTIGGSGENLPSSSSHPSPSTTLQADTGNNDPEKQIATNTNGWSHSLPNSRYNFLTSLAPGSLQVWKARASRFWPVLGKVASRNSTANAQTLSCHNFTPTVRKCKSRLYFLSLSIR